MGWKSSIMQHAIQNGGETIGKVIFHSEISDNPCSGYDWKCNSGNTYHIPGRWQDMDVWMIGIVSIITFILAVIDRQGIDRALTYFIVNIIVCGAVIFAGFFIGTLLTGGFWWFFSTLYGDKFIMSPIFLIFITWKSISSDTNSFPRCRDYTSSYSHAHLHFWQAGHECTPSYHHLFGIHPICLHIRQFQKM